MEHSKKTKRATNEEGDSVSGSGPGNTRTKKPTKNEDLKDEETEDCTDEGFSFVSDDHNSMNTANFEAYFADLCKRLPANSVIVLDNAPYHSRDSESY